jgi:hypothetical protein
METSPEQPTTPAPKINNPMDRKQSFFHENFIAPGGGMWVQGAYKYAGIGLILYGVCLIPLGVVALLIANHSYQFFCYAAIGSSFLAAWIMGLGSLKAQQWTIYAWIGIAVAFIAGLFLVPYGFELWLPALFSVCVAGFGLYYRNTFKKGNIIGILLSIVAVIAAFVLVGTLARPELFGGPTIRERQQALASFFTPETFVKSSKGKVALMQLYGYSNQDIISGNVSDAQILQKISENPQPFNSLVSATNHSFGGYVDSIFLALLPSASV